MNKTYQPKPIIYHWQGVNQQGQPVQGEITAANPLLVKTQLHRQGITPNTIQRKTRSLSIRHNKSISSANIAHFTRQLATMITAGIPLLQSLTIVMTSMKHAGMRTLIDHIKREVTAGATLAAALSRYPRYFDTLFCGLIQSGEQSGTLDTMLNYLAIYQEKQETIKRSVKKALTYPALVMLVACIVTIVLLTQVVPQLTQMFTEFGADLPGFTLLVLHLSAWMQQWWLVLLAILTVLMGIIWQGRKHYPPVAKQADQLLLKCPMLGRIIRHSMAARFARALATTLAAGTPLTHALSTIIDTTSHQIYRQTIQRIHHHVTAGQSLHCAINTHHLFPEPLSSMISIGEVSGTLDIMLDKAATHFEASVDHFINQLTTLLEPLMILVLGVLIGGLMVAMYLPIFQLGAVV